MSEQQLPKAILVVKMSVFMPRPENPEVGDYVEADALRVAINHGAKKLKDLPNGLLKDVREILQGLAELSRMHVFNEPLPEDAKKPSSLILNPDEGITGPPSVQVYVNDGSGKAVELPHRGILDAQGVEIG